MLKNVKTIIGHMDSNIPIEDRLMDRRHFIFYFKNLSKILLHELEEILERLSLHKLQYCFVVNTPEDESLKMLHNSSIIDLKDLKNVAIGSQITEDDFERVKDHVEDIGLAPQTLSDKTCVLLNHATVKLNIMNDYCMLVTNIDSLERISEALCLDHIYINE